MKGGGQAQEGLFEPALAETGLKPEEVIYVGDSLSSDVKGACALGIRPIWINRSGKAVSAKVTSVCRLQDILECETGLE